MHETDSSDGKVTPATSTSCKEVVEMTLQLVLSCLVAALLAVGASVLAVRAALPGWLCRIIELAVLLLAFVWLQQVLRV
jgi:hypothetical protein